MHVLNKHTRGLGGKDYRDGALERLTEARRLVDAGAYAGGVYLAGRGVEGILRAVLWHKDSDIAAGRKSLETGHDLKELLLLVQNLGLLRQRGRDDQFRAQVERTARLWFNNLRFAPNRKLQADWFRLKEIHHRRTLKKAAEDFYNDCTAIIKRCEALLCET